MGKREVHGFRSTNVIRPRSAPPQSAGDAHPHPGSPSVDGRIETAHISPRSAPPLAVRAARIDTRPAVLVLGVYLGGRPNLVANIVANLNSTRDYRVVQRWVSMGGTTNDTQVCRVTCGHRSTQKPKFEVINELLANERLADFEYIIVLDDDIGLPREFLDRFLDAQKVLAFDLAQPARTPDSYIDHLIVKQQQEFFARVTRWVEVGPLVSIHRSIYELLIPFDLRSPMGWGYENVWAFQLLQRGCRMGIIDAYPVEHRLRKPQSFYDWNDANEAQLRLWKAREHLISSECQKNIEYISYASGRTSLDDSQVSKTYSDEERKQLYELVDRLSGSGSSILDWHTGLDVSSTLPECVVVTAGTAGTAKLPYFDESFDIVLVRSDLGNALAEARRIAKRAVVQFGQGRGFYADITRSPARSSLSLSVIIPTLDRVNLLRNCLNGVLNTLPSYLEGEVIVVDDGSTDGTIEFVTSLSNADSRVRFVSGALPRQGFSKACNRGALLARGQILIFLNNDTVPKHGWIAALLETFRHHPNTGAVGGKLLYPDGRLQEAGSIIFADGSAANVGNGESADLPLYNYLREVDYCSAAFLATPKQLFEDLGSFDLRYSPAYYEDTDYCFKVRATGRPVYYQPRCVISHIGGATAGSDVTRGTKRFQAINKSQFFNKWRQVLAALPGCPSDLGSEHWRSIIGKRRLVETRRVLVCAPTLPEFDRESGSRRILSHVEAVLAAKGTVVFVADTGDPRGRYTRHLQQMGVETYCGWTCLDELLRHDSFDAAILAFWHVGERIVPRIRARSPSTKILVDSVDLHFLRNARRTDREWNYQKPKNVGGAHSAEMSRELAVYASADAVLTVSERETEMLRNLLGASAFPVTVPDEEHDHSEWSTVPWQERHGMLFLGNFRHPPNLEAVLYFVHEVLPLIPARVLQKHPLYVVGNALPAELIALAAVQPHIKIIGWAPEIHPYLARSRILVSPLLHGAGTKRKLIQALFAGLPIIASSVAAEGLGLRDKDEFLLANDPTTFVSAITRVIDDVDLSDRLSRCGRVKAEQQHSQRRSHTALRDLLRDLCAAPVDGGK